MNYPIQQNPGHQVYQPGPDMGYLPDPNSVMGDVGMAWPEGWDPNLTIQQLMEMHKWKYTFYNFSSGIVPANGGDFFNIIISDDAHFRNLWWTGSFTTISNAGVPADDDVNHLSIRLQDTGRSLPLFGNFIPLNLFMSPGRRRAVGIAGNPSNQLFYPIPFPYTFKATSTVEIEARNNSDVDNTFEWLFIGEKYRRTPGKTLIQPGGGIVQ